MSKTIAVQGVLSVPEGFEVEARDLGGAKVWCRAGSFYEMQRIHSNLCKLSSSVVCKRMLNHLYKYLATPGYCLPHTRGSGVFWGRPGESIVGANANVCWQSLVQKASSAWNEDPSRVEGWLLGKGCTLPEEDQE